MNLNQVAGRKARNLHQTLVKYLVNHLVIKILVLGCRSIYIYEVEFLLKDEEQAEVLTAFVKSFLNEHKINRRNNARGNYLYPLTRFCNHSRILCKRNATTNNMVELLQFAMEEYKHGRASFYISLWKSTSTKQLCRL
jgi:hypothetical protein